MAVKKPVAFDDVMQVAADQAAEAYGAMEKADQRRTCRWMRNDLKRGQTEAQVRRSAEKKLKPKAIDWDAIATFIERIMPLIKSLIVKV